jgi:hypothetical protein
MTSRTPSSLLSLTAPMTPDPTARWWKYVTAKRLQCPQGHIIPRNSVINETGFVRCTARRGAGTDGRPPGPHVQRDEACGLWVFVFAIVGGGCVVAEVALGEVDDMQRLTTPAQMIEYLGIWERKAAG